MNPSPLLYRLFAEGEIAPAVEAAPWEALLAASETELVLPALHSRLLELDLLSRLPSEITEFLAAVEQLNLERNLAILNELEFAASLLNSVGIEPVLLKGAAYCAAGVYPNAAVRYLWDVDLLIPEPQLPTAAATLIQNGFESQEDYQLGRFRHHHPPLQRPGSIHFELHHSLGMGICQSLLPASEVISHSQPLDFRGARVRIPSPTHLMTHLIMHSQIQHPYNERIWPPLRAMYDLVVLRRHFAGEIDWTLIRRYFEGARQSAVLDLHLLQVQQSLGSEPPYPINLSPITRLRWLRRKLLRRFPLLRFLDPVYMCSTVLLRRVRLLQSALAVPGGWRRILSELSAPTFYKRFITDIITGVGK